MTTPIKVPDPVYEKASRMAERRDISMGAVIEGWMQDAELYQEYVTAGGVTDES